jgi:hypothetical protein
MGSHFGHQLLGFIKPTKFLRTLAAAHASRKSLAVEYARLYSAVPFS